MFVSLMYHNVCERRASEGTWSGYECLSPSVTGYFVDQDTFRRHCTIIAESGQRFDIDRLRTLMSGRSPRESEAAGDSRLPGVLLTFDDGWRDSVDVGGPILEEHGLQALLFVTTDLIGHPFFVDRRQLQGLPSTFAVGSHARTHRLLAELPDDEVRAELADSKAVLEDILGREVDTIAFPGGAFDRRVLRMTREAGYRMIFTSMPAVNHCSRRTNSLPTIGRLAVKTGTPDETLRRWLRGDVRRERIRVRALEGAKRLLGRQTYRRLRSRLISEDATQLEMTDLAASTTEQSLAVSYVRSDEQVPVTTH